jgi:hypothetical protein
LELLRLLEAGKRLPLRRYLNNRGGSNYQGCKLYFSLEVKTRREDFFNMGEELETLKGSCLIQVRE